LDNDVNIFYLGSSLCLEIISGEFGQNVKIVELDERSVLEIEKFADTLVGDILFIGVQNRFLPEVAKKLKMYSIFVDLLGWFWDSIPESHLVADKIYWTNFFNLINGKKSIPDKVDVVGLMHDFIPVNADTQNPFILVSLGGAKNPLVNGLQVNYLKLTCLIFSKLSELLKLKILIASSFDAIEFMKKECIKEINCPSLEFSTFTHKQMLTKMSESSFHYSIGGQGATMESYLAQVPTGFFLPSNLSQEDFQKEIKVSLPQIQTLTWEELLMKEDVFLGMKEKDAIIKIDSICKEIISDNILLNKCIQLLSNMYKNPDTEGVNSLINQMGNDGAKNIVDDIITLLK
jgi:hypothetical protein